MKLPAFATLCLVAAAALVVPPPLAAQVNNRATEAMLKAESLGGLKLGLAAAAVVKQLGQPESQGPLISQEADGTYVQQWKYPGQGLSIQMTTGAKKTGAKTIASFIATPGCTLATRREIKIGSPESAVRKAYGAFEDRESKEAGVLVAGSIYGGIIFNFAKGKVSQIFFGAAAE